MEIAIILAFTAFALLLGNIYHDMVFGRKQKLMFVERQIPVPVKVEAYNTNSIEKRVNKLENKVLETDVNLREIRQKANLKPNTKDKELDEQIVKKINSIIYPR